MTRPTPPASYISDAENRPPGFMSPTIGVRSAIAPKSSMSSGMPNSCAIASRWRTPLVEPPVAATEAMPFSSASRVTMLFGRTSRRTRSMTSSPERRAASSFLGSSAGMPFRPGRRQPDELERGAHRVGRVLAATGARARTRRVLDRMELVERDRAGPIGADRLVDADDVDVATLVGAGVDGPVIERQAGDVEAGERHRRAGHRLVAADEADQPVEQVAAGDQLDRVGDHLAAHERGLHTLRAHRHAVADGDRAELHRCAARCADACLHRIPPGGAGCSCRASSRSTSSRRR